MDEMIRYIFSNFHRTENALDAVKKICRKQKFYNGLIFVFSVASGICLSMIDREQESLREEVNQLQKDVKELKKQKGD